MAGTGIVGRKMREVFSGIEVVFQDKSPGMLSSDAYQNDERILSDVTAIGVSDELFDIIFCRGGLNNLGEDDYPKALRCQPLKKLNRFLLSDKERFLINC